MAAHPRSRGENAYGLAPGGRTGGSSPLTRGKRAGGVMPAGIGGLIPAHAGKTNRPGETLSSSRAHPRSRGENMMRPWAMTAMRWLIPAHAGKTIASRASWLVIGGSSPLTRGKLPAGQVTEVGDGLIPAHAGKTRATGARQTSATAHPRSRGENDWTDPKALLMPGSSPLTRGKLVGRVDGHTDHGLIPAHAGKTDSGSSDAMMPGAHPRSRGENHRMKSVAASLMGSSPLTRGKPLTSSVLGSWSGLIPAHAGKTEMSTSAAALTWAHPRSRGENA